MVSTNKLDIAKIREEFPILHQQVNGKPLIYFDNAATSQKPQCVIRAITDYYSGYNANIHRGVHTLAERATTAFEETRKTVKSFLNAREKEEIIFTKGTTEGLNLIAHSFSQKFIGEHDEIIISGMEHHSNIVPWQIICQQKKATLRVIPILEDGTLDMDSFKRLLSPKTRLVSITYASNTLGTINPVKEVISLSHEQGAKVLIDAAQAAPHLDLDVQELDCDFMAFSAHKAYGPTGVGVLYGKRELLEEIPPYQGGGEMIKDVRFEETTYNDIPYKFEAGTPNIGEVIAMKVSLDFINELGKESIRDHENELLEYGTELLRSIPQVKIIGTAKEKVSVISFIVNGIHHYDLGMWLDAKGIAVRTGHHCTQPLMDLFHIEGTARVSFAVYNTKEEIDIFVEALKDIISKFN